MAQASSGAHGTTNTRTGQQIGWLLSLLPFAVLAGVGYLQLAETQDDAFITYRFAANLAAGKGAVFNVGERVEGYSSPLHLLLSAGLVRLFGSVDILFVSKLVGLAFAALTLGLMVPLGRH